MDKDEYNRSNVSCLFAATTGGLETHGWLEAIVDPPLEACEGTNHDDSGEETCPDSLETDFFVESSNLGSSGSLQRSTLAH